MANLTETSTWESGIYRIETTDPVQGGESGTTNVPIKQLANRTKYLKDAYDALLATAGDLEIAIDDINDHDLSVLGAGLPRHCVVTSKHGAGSSSGASDYFYGSTIGGSSGTIKIAASGAEPFVATVSGGFLADKPVTHYVMLTADLTLAYTGSTDRWVIISTDSQGNPSLLLATKQTYTTSYVAPSSPSDGDYWYNLRLDAMYVRQAGAWRQTNQLIVGYFVPGDGVIIAVGKVGKSAMSLYGRGNVPAGTVHTFAGSVSNGIPDGYLLANGAAISRSVYGDLYATIGTTYGVGDGSTTFNIPDLRGEFIRGLDNSRGVDTGRTLGSYQADELKAHTHTYRGATITPTGSDPTGTGSTFTTGNTGSTGGTETRPRNIAMNFIIKF